MTNIRTALVADPLLPRPNPTASLWQNPAHPIVAAIQSPTLPTLTDYVIIGSGITGCSVARSLLDDCKSPDERPHVTILEARTLCSGATARNGGHLVTPAGHTYGPLAKRYGEEAAKEITRFSIMNIDRLMKLVREMDPKLQEECQMRDVLKVMAVFDEDLWKEVEESVRAFQRGVPEHRTFHRIIERNDVPEKWNVKGACGAVEHEAGAIWPYRLITGMFERLLARYPYNLSIETNTPATSIQYIVPDLSTTPGSDYKYAVSTPRGIIHAKRIVHCTNAYASHLLSPLAGRIYPFRGTMSVQKAGPNLKNLGNEKSWSSMSRSQFDLKSGVFQYGLYYLQQNGKTGDIWVGNECDNVLEALQSDDTYVSEEGRKALLSFLPNYFLEGWPSGSKPDLKAIWTGIQGHTADGLPVVGKVPEHLTGRQGSDDEWVAAGFNGYGMDKCWLTGEALASIMMDRGVATWFPKCFLLTEERLEKTLHLEHALENWRSIATKAT
ncbi:FAD dependent oxidoreductase [Aaosphaeria arxii CBS 175.79]|uniref:FAD dependent oxidoreductase n=1 Tax=Aaosphaeria arxii CBS 175.79 TaxID=1450172 RepID=A0A6A5XC56_9PLEO|nr:FAD dependent oxidoreductase [Aaosphaeria arxii CBS 175.79]KAF2010483.1 FAD dependent oxidoreductase [Aaosphaeria arxii CBS 175.79]